MRCVARTRRREAVAGCLLVWMVAAGGCSAPPSIVPLMRAAERVMVEERRAIGEDGARRAVWLEERRESLAAGFEADLTERERLDVAWVLEGVGAYTASREALLNHEWELRERAATRRENLALAGAALRRGMGLIERQDRLFERVPNLRRWLRDRAAVDTLEEVER